MITLLPEGALQRRQLLARQTLDTAQDRLHEALLLDVARIVRDALPAATHLVLEADDHRYRRPSPFRVHLRRITGPDADLWTRDQEPAVLAGYRTAEGMTWPNVVAHVEQLLTSAIGAERGDNWWKPCRDDGDTVLLCRLPAPADIDAAQARQPQHLDAYLTADDPGSGAALWLSSPALRPTMAVAGVAITASLDADNVLTLEIDPTKTHPQLMRPAGRHTAIRLLRSDVAQPARRDADEPDARATADHVGSPLATGAAPGNPDSAEETGTAAQRVARPAPAPDVPVVAASQLKTLSASLRGDGEMRYGDDVEDDRHDNGRRASFAALAAFAYAGRVGAVSGVNDEEPATVLSDLLGDLRHLADSIGLDFAELDRNGRDHYDAELYGEF